MSDRTERITISPALPCVGAGPWGAKCGKPATVGIAHLQRLATGHSWIMRPYCPDHDPERGKRRQAE